MIINKKKTVWTRFFTFQYWCYWSLQTITVRKWQYKPYKCKKLFCFLILFFQSQALYIWFVNRCAILIQMTIERVRQTYCPKKTYVLWFIVFSSSIRFLFFDKKKIEFKQIFCLFIQINWLYWCLHNFFNEIVAYTKGDIGTYDLRACITLYIVMIATRIEIEWQQTIKVVKFCCFFYYYISIFVSLLNLIRFQ